MVNLEKQTLRSNFYHDHNITLNKKKKKKKIKTTYKNSNGNKGIFKNNNKIMYIN